MEAVSPAKASTPKREISPQRETLADSIELVGLGTRLSQTSKLVRRDSTTPGEQVKCDLCWLVS
jgi:hypothetical protein